MNIWTGGVYINLVLETPKLVRVLFKTTPINMPNLIIFLSMVHKGAIHSHWGGIIRILSIICTIREWDPKSLRRCWSYMEECEIYWPVSSYHNTLPHVNISAASEQLGVISGERQLHMQLPCFRLLKAQMSQTRLCEVLHIKYSWCQHVMTLFS